jgi:ribonuclease P protein component
MFIFSVKNNREFEEISKEYDDAYYTSRVVVLKKKSPEKYVKVSDEKRANAFVRLGLVVSKKIDNRAVRRNLIKRRLRAAFSEVIKGMGSEEINHTDFVIIARKFANDAEYSKLVEDLRLCMDGEAEKGTPFKKR